MFVGLAVGNILPPCLAAGVQRLTLTAVITAAAFGLLAAVGGCTSEQDPGATETNVAPAPCDSDDDCPSHECLGLGGENTGGGSVLGFCEQAPGGSGPGAGGASGR